MIKPIAKSVNGILLLNKPQGLTSNAALQRVKRLFNAKKAGHTGSLDPLATGMLPICFGAATKVSQFLLESDTSYVVHAVLGKRTTTADAEGEVVETRPVPSFTESQLLDLLSNFLGDISQVPPMFSALKHKGQPLYKLARKGTEVSREPRQVKIHDIQLQKFTAESFDILLHCSKGTYVRTLVEDIGERLGCGAYVGKLHRVSVASYQGKPMYSLEDLEGEDDTALQNLLLPIDSALSRLPKVFLSPATTFYLKTGQAVRVSSAPTSGQVRLFDDGGNFIGVGEVTFDGRVKPVRLLAAG